MTEDLKSKTAKTASLYFENYTGERPFDLWRSFDKDLARETFAVHYWSNVLS